MYTRTYDREAGLVVGLAYGEPTWADHTLAMETLSRLDRDACALRRPLVTVLVVDPDAGQPSTCMRQDEARARARLQAPRHLFLLVSTSAAARAIVSPVDARRAAADRFHCEAFASFGSAVHRAERERGHPLPRLYSLLAEAQRHRNELAGGERASGARVRAQAALPAQAGAPAAQAIAVVGARHPRAGR